MNDLPVSDVERYMRTLPSGPVTDNVSRLRFAVIHCPSRTGKLSAGRPADGISKVRIDQAGKTGAVCSACQRLAAMNIAVAKILHRIVHDLAAQV